jgi:hypothetical protein
MAAAFFLGLIFYFCDPNDEKYEYLRLWAIAILIGGIGIAALVVFFRSNPPLISID